MQPVDGTAQELCQTRDASSIVPEKFPSRASASRTDRDPRTVLSGAVATSTTTVCSVPSIRRVP